MSDRPLPRRQSRMPEPTDYTDPTIADARVAEKDMREDRLREVESAILSTPAGREWLWGVLNSADLFNDRMAVSESDYERGLFSGRQSVAKGMMRRFCRVNPENWARMVVENDV